MHQRIGNTSRAEDLNRWGHGVQVVHPGAEDDRFPVAGHMTDQGVVIALPGADFVGHDVHPFQTHGGSPGEGRTQVCQALGFGVGLQRGVFFLAQRTAFHDFPNGFGCVPRLNVVGDHFVFHDVALELDALGTGRMRIINHAFGFFQASLMIDSNLGHHIGWIGVADCSACNLDSAHGNPSDDR